MKNKKWIECVVVLALTCALALTAVLTKDTSNEQIDVANDQTQAVSSDKVIAGVAGVLSDYEIRTSEEMEQRITFESEEYTPVAASADSSLMQENNQLKAESNVTLQETSSLTPEEEEWQDKLMADVEDFMNVRKSASENSKIVGKLYKGDRALVVKKGKTWTKIKSGNVKGYVKNKYCVYGSEALSYAKKNCDTIATANSDGLRIRAKMNTESSIINTMDKGDSIKVDTKAKVSDGWVAVTDGSETYYVSSDYVKISLKTGKAVTIEEEQAREAQAAEAKAAVASNQKASSGVKQGGSIAATADDVTLLAALIQCEVGGLSYDCQLAVGAVVVNRMKSGAYPSTLRGVINQPYQFGPARNGLLEKRLRNGVSATAKRAAKAALGGADNTNGAIGFKLKSSGHKGVVIDCIVFF